MKKGIPEENRKGIIITAKGEESVLFKKTKQ